MPDTVKIKSDAHPSGFIIVNKDDPRAKVEKPTEKPASKKKNKKSK